MVDPMYGIMSSEQAALTIRDAATQAAEAERAAVVAWIGLIIDCTKEHADGLMQDADIYYWNGRVDALQFLADAIEALAHLENRP